MVNKIQILEWLFPVVWKHDGDYPPYVYAICFRLEDANRIAYNLVKDDEYKILVSYRGVTSKFK